MSRQCFSDIEGRFAQFWCNPMQKCCDGECCDADYDYKFYTHWYFWLAASALVLLMGAAILSGYCRFCRRCVDNLPLIGGIHGQRLLDCSWAWSLDEDKQPYRFTGQTNYRPRPTSQQQQCVRPICPLARAESCDGCLETVTNGTDVNSCDTQIPSICGSEKSFTVRNLTAPLDEGGNLYHINEPVTPCDQGDQMSSLDSSLEPHDQPEKVFDQEESYDQSETCIQYSIPDEGTQLCEETDYHFQHVVPITTTHKEEMRHENGDTESARYLVRL